MHVQSPSPEQWLRSAALHLVRLQQVGVQTARKRDARCGVARVICNFLDRFGDMPMISF